MREPVSTSAAPAAIGPYSQAIKAGDFLFASGQIPLDPATGTLVTGGIAEQTHQVLKNLGGVLAAAGIGFDKVVKTTVYLSDMSADACGLAPVRTLSAPWCLCESAICHLTVYRHRSSPLRPCTWPLPSLLYL